MDEAPEGSIEHAAKSSRNLTAHERAARNRALVADRLKPMSWPLLAAKYHLDESACRRVFYDWRKTNEGKAHTDLSGRDPIEIVWDSAARYEGWIEALSEIAFAPDTQDSVRVGAINAQMAAQEKLTNLLQATGILPKQLGRLRIEADVRYVAKAILQVFQEEEVPEHVQRRVIAVLSPSSASQN